MKQKCAFHIIRAKNFRERKNFPVWLPLLGPLCLKEKEQGKLSGTIQTLTLTFCLGHCHCSPFDSPTRSCNFPISEEPQLGNIVFACIFVIHHRSAAPFPHKLCPVPAQQCQVVMGTVGLPPAIFNVKMSELYVNAKSRSHCYGAY